MSFALAQETVWYDKWRVDDAERQYYEKLYGVTVGNNTNLGNLANQIAKAREEIQHTLASNTKIGSTGTNANSSIPPDLLNKITKLEGMNIHLTKTISTLESTVEDLKKRLSALECGAKPTVSTPATSAQKEPAVVAESTNDDDDDDVDLFGSDDEEDQEAARVREERLKAYAEKKAKKPGPIAKSSVLLDCKPWDDETDMKAMEKAVRKIEMDGLTWGAAKLVPLAYGIQKLSILCTVEDEKVSIDDLIEKITENEDYVQSVDIGAFNKI